MSDCPKDKESFKRWGATSQGERKGERSVRDFCGTRS